MNLKDTILKERSEMEIGILIHLSDNADDDFRKVSEMGFSSCQLTCWNMNYFNDEKAEEVLAAMKKYNIEITTFWCGWSGPAVWNFTEGPLTLGIVPAEYRFKRTEELKLGGDFAKKLGVKNVATHMGFIPEVPASEQYRAVVAAIRNIAEHLKENDQNLLFETGQETPVTLRRAIEDVGTGNLGINLDPANLILYGKANPIDSLDVFGDLVMNVHAKDGCYPTCGKNLGEEKPIGAGKVDFPRFIAKLKEVGYDGPLTIEREITGEQQKHDILVAKNLLEGLI